MANMSFPIMVDYILKQKDINVSRKFIEEIVELLYDNRITPRFKEIEQHKESPLTHFYKIVFEGLDFSEHDKKFLEEIQELKTENAELHCELQAMQVFSDELPSEPIEVAQMLINAVGAHTRLYDISQLRQIAEHLLVYCNNNKEER